MSTTVTHIKHSPNEALLDTQKCVATASTDVTDWMQITGTVAIQITGVATAVTAKIERSTENPVSSTANPVQIGADLTGNPSTTGIYSSSTEPGAAYWRVRLTAMTGVSCNIYISAKRV